MGTWDGEPLKEQKKGPLNLSKAKKWFKARSQKEKMGLIGGAAFLAILLMWKTVDNHDNLFVAAELIHFAGIGWLLYKLTQEKSCAGLSLKTQDLTVMFLGVRLYCSFAMEQDVHTLLDLLTLVASVWVMFMMRTKLKSTYNEDVDTISVAHVAVPAGVLACIAHPVTNHFVLHRILWAFCVYLESVSVLPQLRMMQKNQVVERFTANYVFSLGIARFLSCAHWILQILNGDSFFLSAIGSGLWPLMVLLSEIVQTFILSDFCYYYIKSLADGGSVVRIPAGIV